MASIARLESVPKSLSITDLYQNSPAEGYRNMLVGFMRVSSDSDRQTTDLQRDALLAAGVDERHLFEDKASGARLDRSGLVVALDYVRAGGGRRLPAWALWHHRTEVVWLIPSATPYWWQNMKARDTLSEGFRARQFGIRLNGEHAPVAKASEGGATRASSLIEPVRLLCVAHTSNE